MARVSAETTQTTRRLQSLASLMLLTLVVLSLASQALSAANQQQQARRYSANTNKLNGYPSSYPATPMDAPTNQRARASRRAQPAPVEEQPEESARVKGEVGADESMAMDPEFNALTSDMDSANSDVKDDVDMDADEPVERAPRRPTSSQAAASRPSNRASLVGTLESVRGANEDESDDYSADEPSGLASALAGTLVRSHEGEGDLLMAAGHHHQHHHGHYAHGWLEMGAHTGKKGAFGWHDKHPVGGKGR